MFDKLVQDLSQGERFQLLEQLGGEKSRNVVTQDPLRKLDEKQQSFNYETAFQNLKWWEKLVITLKALFTQQSREELLEELVLNKLGRSIERNYNNLYNHSNGRLQSNFYWNIKKLQDKLEFLREPLRRALGVQKKDFFAFFAGLEMQDIQDRLLLELDPERIAYEKSVSDPYKVRKEIEFQLEDIFESIDEARKNILYSRIRHLYHLSNIISFPYEKILYPFEKQIGGELNVVLKEIRSPLLDFCKVMLSAKSPPAENLLKVIFLFSLQTSRENESEEDFDRRMQSYLRRTEEALSYIRFFHVHMPLLDLSRLVLRNIEFVPEEVPGGEDWYSLFRQFWYDRFEQRMKKYTSQYKRQELLDSAKSFLRKEQIPELHRYCNLGKYYNIAVQYEKSSGFAWGFFEDYFFPEMNSSLKLVLIDGEFYKEQNREEYNEAYNTVVWAYEQLRKLESYLSSDGEIGLQVENVEKEALSEEERRQEVQEIVRDVDNQMEVILSRLLEHSILMKNLLDGILHGDMGGRYDTLSNMGFIGRNENKNLKSKLSNALKRFEGFIDYYSQLYDLERNNGRVE